MKMLFSLAEEKPVFAEFGKIAYIISAGNSVYDKKSFKEKCPCCGDSGKIQHNGFWIKCSVCEQQRGYISVTNWLVKEYIVNDIRVTGPDYRKAYGKNTNPQDLPKVTEIKGFHRTANGYANVHTRKLPICPEHIDPEATEKGMMLFDADVFAFTTKARAEAACEYLKEKDRKALEEFNRTYGTSHEYPY